MKVHNLAQKVSNNVEGDHEVFIDPLTISIISLVISSLFQAARLYCELNTANEMRSACTNPSLLQKRMIRQEVSRHDINNQLTYRQQQDVVAAILRTGSSTTIHDLEEAIKEDDEQEGVWGEWEV